MDLHKKLKRRIIQPIVAYAARVTAAWKLALKVSAVTRATIEARMRPSIYPPGQWHRWYKAERKRQRQVANCIPRGQRHLYPSLKREMIR